MKLKTPDEKCTRVDGPHAVAQLMYPSDPRGRRGLTPGNLVGLSLVDTTTVPRTEVCWVPDFAASLEPGIALELAMLVPSARYLRAIHRPRGFSFVLVSATRSFGAAPPRALDDLVIAIVGRRLAETSCFFLIRPPTPRGEVNEEVLSFVRSFGGGWTLVGNGEILDVRSTDGPRPCLWGRDRAGRLRILSHESAREGSFDERFWDYVDGQHGVRAIPARFNPTHCPLTVDFGVAYADVSTICTGVVNPVWAAELPNGTRVVGKLEHAPRADGEAWVLERQNGEATPRQAAALVPIERGLPSFLSVAEALAAPPLP